MTMRTKVSANRFDSIEILGEMFSIISMDKKNRLLEFVMVYDDDESPAISTDLTDLFDYYICINESYEEVSLGDEFLDGVKLPNGKTLRAEVIARACEIAEKYGTWEVDHIERQTMEGK